MMRSLTLLYFLCAVVFSTCSNEELRSSSKSIQIAQTIGQPWPLPQSMRITTQQYAIHPAAFHFLANQSSQTCDLLTSALDRYFQLIFFPRTYFDYIFNPETIDQQKQISKLQRNLNDVPMLKQLNIFIQQPCEQYPTLESNESCNLVQEKQFSS